MEFNSFSEFLAMGGYGFYVWLSFGSCAFILIALLVTSLLEKRNVLKQVAAQSAREQRIERAKRSQQESSL
ncbi:MULTISPECIES: heme exporter protein CcmD [Pseudoalteromonas]|uniref:Heme exporter protein D n=1 Tax=Pseudoalteromonas ruthenica TaxID=151081 RepID=A0A0F4PKL8_9GAMM|nr:MULTISPECIES: heme exporter protein CcmD [Pseudoalteromonas]KJY96080.1 heme exporter protein D [Pseudoalteromonas ruthenica]KJY96768.1 heme exporter protein D [Pseudoalteromonas ruthenica]MCF2863502.1 heme exporter protein CcmD [Pseudoalteromonas sp. CNAT2-18]MCG7544817.1 heme exporter protein CcmD [Pseudoalteromonas sp. MM17-2]MCG7558455.1 heme exporter protein CcmD [Pseudoalteromonas sp. CNAT2-18.1]|tara:strand:- start:1968 stop:2180 length:213 start_codon:yes stop_codon:yes gene_type:complete